MTESKYTWDQAEWDIVFLSTGLFDRDYNPGDFHVGYPVVFYNPKEETE